MVNVKDKLPFVSIVIPVFNAEEFIVQALESVLRTNYPHFEVVIIDDKSTDRTVRIIKKKFGSNRKIKFFKNKTKLLAAGSRNQGVLQAKAEFIALLDHDIEVDTNWITEMVKVMKKYPSCGVVQGKVMDIKSRFTIQHAGVKINASLGWVVPVGFGLDGRKNYIKEVRAFANATGLMFKKSVWEEVGGFDEMLQINTDDWDFNWRTNLYGHEHFLAPKSITYHWSKKQQTRDVWINRSNWEFHFAKVPWIFIKNYELKNIIRFLPVYLIVNILRGIFNLIFRLNSAPIIGFSRSLFWLANNFSILMDKRKEVQNKRQINDENLLSLFDRSTVIDYFRKYWLHAFKIGKKLSTENPY